MGFTCRPFEQKNPYLSSVVVNKELHDAGDRSCRHIEFDISEARMRLVVAFFLKELSFVLFWFICSLHKSNTSHTSKV